MVYSRSGLKKEANIALKKFYITSKIVVTYNNSRVQPAEQQKHHIEQSIYRDIYKYIYNANIIRRPSLVGIGQTAEALCPS